MGRRARMRREVGPRSGSSTLRKKCFILYLLAQGNPAGRTDACARRALPFGVAMESVVTRHPRSPEAFLPLSAPVLNILLAIGSDRMHPYRIMQEIDRRTGGKAVILPGTLYTSIARMLDQGLVEDAPDRPEPEDDDARRRYYRLTGLGRRVAAAEVERMAALIRVAKEQDLVPGEVS